MPWSTPTLKDVRSIVRDDIRSSLPGADATVPNSVLRVMSDAQAGLCHLTLQYIDWLALQLLPDTAETEWLDRHGDIWLVNADGTTGRKMASFAVGVANFTGVFGTVIPAGSPMEGFAPGFAESMGFETTEDITLDNGPTPGAIRSLDAGALTNLDPDSLLNLTPPIPNVDISATVINLAGGTDTETDDELRLRVLQRIRQPPQGGAAHDYVRWALAVPGVTRAWCTPLEMGMGTVTVRFMMDDLRADVDGFPTGADVAAVEAYIDTVRPVAVKDVFVVAPIPEPIDVMIEDLVPDTPSQRAAVEESIIDMMKRLAAPGQTIFVAWISFAIMETPGVESFHIKNTIDHEMPSPGHLAVLGDISFATSPNAIP